MPHFVVHLHPEAPPKPAPGQRCNGCGVCCAWQPCPLGMLLSRSVRGPCLALDWVAHERRYRCAALTRPRAGPPGAPRWLTAALRRLAGRWISAGTGCDCTLQPEPPH